MDVDVDVFTLNCCNSNECWTLKQTLKTKFSRRDGCSELIKVSLMSTVISDTIKARILERGMQIKEAQIYFNNQITNNTEHFQNVRTGKILN